MARKPKEQDIDKLFDLSEIEVEMTRVRSKGRFRQALRGTAGTVVVVAALAVLVATMLLGPAPKEAKTNSEAVDIASDRIDDITAKFNDTMAKWSKYLS